MLRFTRAFAVALVIGFAVLTPAAAQVYPLHHVGAPAADLVKTGFSNPYGQKVDALITEIIKDSAAPACAQDPGIQQPLAVRVNAILQKRGTQIVELYTQAVAPVTFRDAVAAKLGAGALDELEALKSNPVVQEYIALEAPTRAAMTVNDVMEVLRLYLAHRQIKLARDIPKWFEQDLPDLAKADPAMNDEEMLNAFQKQAKSQPLDRYVELKGEAWEILNALFREQSVKNLDEVVHFAGGFDADLADLCVKVR